MIKSIELKFKSGNDVQVDRAIITRNEFIQIQQQAETIERLKNDRQILLDACESATEIINLYLEGDAVIKTCDLEDIRKALNKLKAGEL